MGVFATPPQNPAPPTTTVQQDMTTAGQRKINLIWEYTQALIAVVVVACTMVTGTWMMVAGSKAEVPTIMAVAFGMVVGSYFQRTNHMNVGGVGRKPEQTYEGR